MLFVVVMKLRQWEILVLVVMWLCVMKQSVCPCLSLIDLPASSVAGRVANASPEIGITCKPPVYALESFATTPHDNL